jgi:hypothetical protein
VILTLIQSSYEKKISLTIQHAPIGSLSANR